MFNQREIMRMMQRMGMQMTNIDAKRVIIEKEDGSQIIIDNPSISKISMQGQNVFQITGKEKTINFNEDDIKLVMQQANVSKEEAIKALEESNGDLAEAIMKLQEQSDE